MSSGIVSYILKSRTKNH